MEGIELDAIVFSIIRDNTERNLKAILSIIFKELPDVPKAEIVDSIGRLSK